MKLSRFRMFVFTLPAVSCFALTSRGADDSLSDVKLQALSGSPVAVRPADNGVTALVFISSECPISSAYSPALNSLAREFPKDRLQLVGVCVDPDASSEVLLKYAQEYELNFQVARDRRGSLARRLGVTVTPEAVVIDSAGKVCYRGRIDDQFAARQKRNAVPRTHELRDAVAAVLAGKQVAEPVVAAVGCPLPEVARPSEVPTYANAVAAILQRNCLECHRPGQVGPFSLENYEQARKRSRDIANVAETRAMPPWKAVPGVGLEMAHSRALSEADINTLVGWSDNGAPAGDLSKAPAPPSFPEGWALGTPDLVIETPEFAIPASGEDVYRCFVLPTTLPEDVYLTAIEYRPGNRRVVHHVLAYVDTAGGGRKKDEAEPGPGYTCFSGVGVEIHGDLGGWAPGNEPNHLPEGVGRSLPKGADVIVQIHYHPSGKAETDRTKLGLHFAKKPVKQVLHWAFALNEKMEIPAGAKGFEVKARWTAPLDLIAYAATPHMHLLGRDIAMSITFPDGRRQELVKIADWDFNWQNTYYFKQPLDIPKGSILEVVSHYDNTEANPRNVIRPLRTVRWGEATTDEMCIGFLGVTKRGQDLTQPGQKDDLLQLLYGRED